MKKIIIAALLCLILQGVTAPIHATCQGGDCDYGPECEGVNPLSEVFTSEGNKPIRFDNLSEPEEIRIPSPVHGIDYVYLRYVTPCGNVVLIPSTSTTLAMIVDPNARLPEGGQSYATGWYSWAQSLAGVTLPDGRNAADAMEEIIKHCGYEDDEQAFIDDLINGTGCAWTWGLNTSWQLLQLFMDFESNPDHILPTAVAVYPSGSCAGLPGGCPPCPNKTPVPPSAAVCSKATIMSNPITASVYKSGPQNPVVVGQDPARRGADIEANVTVPPVIYNWYEAIPVNEDGCRLRKFSDGSRPNDCKLNFTDIGYTGVSYTYIARYDCKQHIEILEDRVVSMTVMASLDSASQAWIRGHLASIWYNAHIFQPFWQIIPGIGTLSASCDASKTCFGIGSAFRIPFRDPGNYILALSGRTSGTKVSNPRTFRAGGPLVVKVILVQETWPQ